MSLYGGLQRGKARRLLAAGAVMAVGLVMGAGPSVADANGKGKSAGHETGSTAQVLKGVVVKAPDVTVKGLDVTVKAPHVTVKGLDVTVKAPHVTVKGHDVTVTAPHVTVKGPHGTLQGPKVTPSTVTVTPKKVWVCKIVSHEGAYRLKAGKQPIHVSANALTGDVNPVVGAPFSDAQPSFVVASDNRALCDAGLPKPPSQPVPGISVVKTATVLGTNTNGKADAGELIAYSFLVRNTGNVTLTGVTVVDLRLGSAVTCAATTLVPGATTTCTPAAAYLVTASDVAAGLPIVNTATATGTEPGGGTVTDTDTVSTPTQQPPTAPVPGIAVAKTATLVDTNGNAVADAGETITYSFLVTNTGNVTLTGVTVVDLRLGSAVTCAATTLVPGATTTCLPAAAYTVTAEDVAAGSPIVNTATASGQPPTGSPVTGTDTVRTPTRVPPALLGIAENAPAAPAAPTAPTPATAPAVGTLAFTGAEFLPFTLSGLLALALGAVLTVSGRRRTEGRARE